MSYVLIIIATLLVLITPETFTFYIVATMSYKGITYMIIPFQPYATVISMEEAIFESMKLLMQQYLLQTFSIRMLSNTRLNNWLTHCTPKNLLAMIATTIFLGPLHP